jgi:hypothetical protein
VCDVTIVTIGYMSFVFCLVEALLRSDIIINGIENYDSLSFYEFQYVYDGTPMYKK